jgi:multidrug efflux pump subunit AcrA (membrane-fusion protein)
VARIAPEVEGRVTSIHPRLEVGEIIEKGDILFRMDSSDYETARDEAAAEVAALQYKIEWSRKQGEKDAQRLATLCRNLVLARADVERMEGLYRNRTVSRKAVDEKERALNQVKEAVETLEGQMAVLPFQIGERESLLKAARARLESARKKIQRCELRAPFRGRIKEVRLEQGHILSKGETCITLADDSVMELLVPLNPERAERLLRAQRAGGSIENGMARFPCRITSTLGNDRLSWRGFVHRIVKFDPDSRTLVVAVRMEDENAKARGPHDLPPLEGMFCRVEIPVEKLEQVYRLPREAVTDDDRVFIARDQRLTSRPVHVVFREGDVVFVDSGLAPEDQVVITRLTHPVEESPLRVRVISEGDIVDP